jgi:hypothetical protein
MKLSTSERNEVVGAAIVDGTGAMTRKIGMRRRAHDGTRIPKTRSISTINRKRITGFSIIMRRGTKRKSLSIYIANTTASLTPNMIIEKSSKNGIENTVVGMVMTMRRVRRSIVTPNDENIEMMRNREKAGSMSMRRIETDIIRNCQLKKQNSRSIKANYFH